MKKILSVIVLSLLLTAIFTACGSVEDNVAAALSEEFNLPAGKTAVIEGEDLSIRFLEVTNDSRCPSDVVCIQMGDAKCDIAFKLNNSEYPMTLIAGGNQTSEVVFEGYTINFNLQPYPVSTQQIAPGDYYLVMTVRK